MPPGAGRWQHLPALAEHRSSLVPVAFAVTVPAEALTGRLTPGTLVGAVALALLLMLLARWVFNQGLRRSGGASLEGAGRT